MVPEQPQRRPGIIADPFDSLWVADEQTLDELCEHWRRYLQQRRLTPRAAAAPAPTAGTGRFRTILEITFSADRDPVFSDGRSFQDVVLPVDDDDDAYRGGGFGAVRASRAAIEGLPVVPPGEAVKEEECAVCLEGFGREEGGGDDGKGIIRKMPCPDSHAFHEACIFRWLSVSRVCPLCRFPLPAPDDDDDDDDENESDAE